MDKPADEAEKQRRYYAETASRYDDMHLGEHDEHFLALALLVGVVDYLKVTSILDVGSGTGRALCYLKERRPELRVVGIEPVQELREMGHAKGLPEAELIEGDATALPYDASSFDLVCEFGALHHMRKPSHAVAEMLRVADRAIFISDANNFGQGSAVSRLVKQLINAFGLWGLADLVKTRGKGYHMTEGDGLAYSYSVFKDYRQIEAQCREIHLLNTKEGRINPYRTAHQVALLGIKK